MAETFIIRFDEQSVAETVCRGIKLWEHNLRPFLNNLGNGYEVTVPCHINERLRKELNGYARGVYDTLKKRNAS